MTHVLEEPGVQLAADSRETLNYKRDPYNFITQLFGEQLPAIQNGFFNVHLSKGIVIQPHWHTNVTEMVYVIAGEVITSVFNPFTRKLMTYYLKPGQVSLFPKGWFHWIIAATDHAHMLTIFDQPTPDIVYGSDFLRFTPKEVMQRAYCINEEDYAKAVAPLQESVILGPPVGCVNSQTAYGFGMLAGCSCEQAEPMSGYAAPFAGYVPQQSAGCSQAVYSEAANSLMRECLQAVEASVQQGLKQASNENMEHGLRQASVVSYLIGKGYSPTAAHQIAETWRNGE